MIKKIVKVISILVAITAIAMNFKFSSNKVAWHEGKDWENYLVLYDKYTEVFERDLGCQNKLIVTLQGNTNVFICGNKKNGKPLLMFHGAGSSAIIYSKWITPKLIDNHLVIVVDYVCDVTRSSPVHNSTTNCPANEQDIINWVEEIIDKTIPPPKKSSVSLLGYSYGAFIAALVGLRKPEIVDKLVLLAPAGVFAPFIYNGDGFCLENWMSAVKGFSYIRDVPEFVELGRAAKKVSPSATVLKVNPWHFSVDEINRMTNKDHRTLVIVGKDERVMKGDVLIQTLDKVKENEYLIAKVLEDAGHLMIIEKGKEIEDEVHKFLNTKE